MPPRSPEELSYGEFSAALHREGNRTRAPLNGTFEVTYRCPLECSHCYNNLPMADAEARSRELSLAEHERLLDEAAEAGALWLLYTGGEIFARPDFLEIYRAARSRGFVITLFTNGILITERIADFLAEHRPFTVEITLYGRTRETYETLTRIPGSHERCYRAVDMLQARGVPLKLKTVAVSVNRHEVKAMQAFAEERGLAFKFDSAMTPRIDCSQSPLAVRLRPEEVVAFDLDFPHRAAEWRQFAGEHPGPVSVDPEPELYHCGGGLNSFNVDPEGRLSICLLSRRDTYDLRRGSFREGWERFLGEVRARPARRVTKCTRCGLKAMCGMCPANGELETGDPESPVEFLCQVAHLRARALGIPIPEHGDCEYCPGGSRERELEESLARLLAMPEGRRVEALRRATPLPVLQPAGTGAGCGRGCG